MFGTGYFQKQHYNSANCIECNKGLQLIDQMTIHLRCNGWQCIAQ